MSLTVLIADDDRDLARIVAYAARQVWPGCRTLIADDGGTACATSRPKGRTW